MTDDWIKLGKRAVACKGWRWMPGMLAVEWAAPGMGLTGGRPVRVDERWHEVNVWLPDFTDPATLGCLLALARKAYCDPYASVWYSADYNHSGDRWSYYSKAFSFSGHATEAEALVAALEGAP